ncbi:MAG: hypothetical protein HF314_10805 [Ignavibacteria bacterium]|jgi:hypothetical protein|nr:hypothetical protein [Ignavibacteria bacterium]MCU7503555.1 hypothetical protein [Ignavibacteria bacterium]MCU7516791.1 hypothetical protein [Ignavibacteria bacterium]
MKNIKYILSLPVLILLMTKNLSAQELYSPGQFFKTIFESGSNVNSYYIGGNPAFLKWENENKEQLLSIQSSYQNEDGAFHKFIEPATNRLYQVMATGRKDIDSSQVFKGSFGFERQERRNWSWLVTKNYSIMNPFLFGDSTTGNTHYNGIIMNAQYGAEVWKGLLAGFEVNYAVDQGLKEVAPRPTSDHRDIMFKLGLGYRVTDNLSIGAVGKFYDYNEEISYKEDEGAVAKEILLLKFKGYDFPFTNKKKTEERFSYQNGAFGYFTVSYKTPGFSVAAYAGGGLEQLTIKEDALDPRRQGYWKNSTVEAALQSSIDLSKDLKLGLYYEFKNEDMWARHPEYEVLMMENSSPSHLVASGLQYVLSPAATLGLEAGASRQSYDYKDYYSALSWATKGVEAFASAGVNMRWSRLFSTFISYRFSNFAADDSKLTVSEPSAYFTDYRLKDIAFYQTDFRQQTGNFWLRVEPGTWGLISLKISYSNKKAMDDVVFSSLKRDDFTSCLELRLKVY